MTLKIVLKGGEGSGHHGHGGRPGSIGGSVAGTGGGKMTAAQVASPKTAHEYFMQHLPDARVTRKPDIVQGTHYWSGISTSATIDNTRKAAADAGFRTVSKNIFSKRGVNIQMMDISRRSDLPGNTQFSISGKDK